MELIKGWKFNSLQEAEIFIAKKNAEFGLKTATAVDNGNFAYIHYDSELEEHFLFGKPQEFEI
jgi:hypothetical protein